MPTSLVTGGAGFLGSHLCEALLAKGHRVICLDNLETGSLANIECLRDDAFTFVHHDVSESIARENICWNIRRDCRRRSSHGPGRDQAESNAFSRIGSGSCSRTTAGYWNPARGSSDCAGKITWA